MLLYNVCSMVLWFQPQNNNGCFQNRVTNMYTVVWWSLSKHYIMIMQAKEITTIIVVENRCSVYAVAINNSKHLLETFISENIWNICCYSSSWQMNVDEFWSGYTNVSLPLTQCFYLGKKCVSLSSHLQANLLLGIWKWNSSFVKQSVFSNLVPRASPLHVPGSERGETLVGSGQVSPRIWEITNKWLERGAVECQFAYTKCTGDGKTCPSQVNLRFACVSKVMSSGHSETPIKINKASESVNVSCYRLCKSVEDTSHWRNLYSKGNRLLSLLLMAAKELYGDALPRSEFFATFTLRVVKSTISESQASLKSSGASRSRLPRCIWQPGKNQTWPEMYLEAIVAAD